MLPINYRDKKICIIGLGYVGLTLAVAMADAGFRVHGVETNPEILKCLEEGRAHFSEVGLNERLALQINNGRFTFAPKVMPDEETTVYVVTVGTPLNNHKRTNYDSFKAVMAAISTVIQEGDMVVLRSTVRVGVTTEFAKPVLDATGKWYDLAFCPERTLEGKALAELSTLPQVVGGINDRSTFRASQLFSFLTPSIVRVQNSETAEMVKLINNTQRDMIFAFANEVAEMCDQLGISAKEVIASGNLGYPRANLPYPGPVGGPCLEKDPYILAEGLEHIGYKPQISMTGRLWNEGLPQRTVARMASELRERGAPADLKIAVLGAAFKGRPETDDLRGSLVVQIISELKTAFPEAQLTAWDPIVTVPNLKTLGLEAYESVEEAFDGASLVIMQNNHPVLERLKLGKLSELMQKPGLLFDYWHQHDLRVNAELAEGVRYAPLGAFNAKMEIAQ
ncbi:nucleotide sugar dehydrogenase [Asticcacaulis sp. DXS10W]|uniref:Nucleotide sugar dehydrogenase n=1 Tax=Asticcacaulis currens TaxID=2984210 RepID=A0ABT5I9B6_9CAUL|nr:nucleotide sugar dehydrogenase [Asticcacaulis currens]MDC7692781.1 nucleotide sugar dehydrogenase [Asticcacaulis currens]